jgi:hypothetical protein
MRGRPSIAIHLALGLTLGACTSGTAPQLPAGPEAIDTSKGQPAAAAPEPVTTAVTTKGTPTEVYEVVARNVLGCWFGAGGALKASHVFHAEAAPPAEGGAAEIVLHERDPSFRDQRGARAFRVTFVNAAGLVQVGISNMKIAPPLAGAMVRDVEAWAGGGTGCQVRGLYSPPASAKAKDKTSAKGSGQR